MLDAELLYPPTQAPGWRLYTAANSFADQSMSSILRLIILSLLKLLVGFLW